MIEIEEMNQPHPSSEIQLTGEQMNQLLGNLENFEESRDEILRYLRIPNPQGAVAPPKDRVDTLKILPLIKWHEASEGVIEEEKFLARYITAINAGLFDAAINYLWNAAIDNLRSKVGNGDIELFAQEFHTKDGKATKKSEAIENLRWQVLTDQEFIEACHNIGYLSTVAKDKLHFVRTLRNKLSAAHPNDESVTPIELAHCTEIILKETLFAPTVPISINKNALIRALRRGEIDPSNLSIEKEALATFRREDSEGAALALFDIYTESSTPENSKRAIQELFPTLWEHLNERARKKSADKLLRYTNDANQEARDLGLQLLESVCGYSYLPQQIFEVELKRSIDTLEKVHSEWDNFYREPSPARRLAEITTVRKVPSNLLDYFLKTILRCYIGNSSGFSRNAAPHYRCILSSLPEEHKIAAILLISDEAFIRNEHNLSGRLEDLLNPLLEHLTNERAVELADKIRSYKGQLYQIHKDTGVERLRDGLIVDLPS